MRSSDLIVFTDLDGTLMEHDSYSWAPALPALSRLRAGNVPVVLASSKTAAEIAPIRAEMRLGAVTAIVENGAGLLPPGDAAADLGEDYARLRQILDALPSDLRASFQGFGDWTDDRVAAETGLPLETAHLARRRAFSEPGRWSGDAESRRAFIEALEAEGVTARRGGRFLTLSFGATKADQMATLIAQFGAKRSVALGDAPNDVEMLQAADIGIIIANPDGPGLPTLAGEREGRIRRSVKSGPAGWNEMILGLVSEQTS